MSTQAVTGVIVDSWATQSRVRNAILVMGLTGFTAIAAQVAIPLPFTPVPLTLQTFAVLAGAAALGAERAVIAQDFTLLWQWQAHQFWQVEQVVMKLSLAQLVVT